MYTRNHFDSLRTVGLAALTATMLVGASGAQAQFQNRNLRLEAGTVIPVKLNTQLSSKDSHQGDTFTATIRSDNNTGNYGLPSDAQIEGVVRDVRPYRDSKTPGVIDLDFRRIRFADGRTLPIQGSLIGLGNDSVTRSGGHLVAKSGHRTNRLTYVGYGAGAGLLVSLLTKSTLRDTLIGGGLGYLYGALEKGSSKDARDVTLKSGTQFGVRLDRQLSLANYGGNGSYNNNSNRGGLPGNRDNGSNGGLPGNRNDDSFNNQGLPTNNNGDNVNRGGLPNDNGNNSNRGGLPGNYVSDDHAGGNGNNPTGGVNGDNGAFGNGNGNRRGGLPDDANGGNGATFGGNGNRMQNRNSFGRATNSRRSISVVLNGRNLAFTGGQKPIVQNDTVLLPMRNIMDAAHLPYDYNPLTREITARSGSRSLRLTANSNTATADDGSTVRMDTPARSINGTLYVPLSFFQTLTGRSASYDPSRRVVTMSIGRDTLNSNGNRDNGNGNRGGLPTGN